MSIGDDAKKIAAFKKQFRAAYPIVPDEERKIWEILEQPGTPTMLTCEKDGKVLAVHGGPTENFDELLKGIRELHAKL